MDYVVDGDKPNENRNIPNKPPTELAYWIDDTATWWVICF